MLNFSSHLQWFQAKIGSYDKQIWETSVEQRILQGLENRPKRDGSLHKELIDIDLVRGSTFSKAKPRHGLKSVIFNGLKRVIFFPYYFNQWQDHFNKEVVYLFLFHYIIQLIQLTLYFVWSNSSEIMLEEILLPIILALSLGVLHAHIIAPYSVKQRRKKTFSSSSGKLKSTSKADSVSSGLTPASRQQSLQSPVITQLSDSSQQGLKDAKKSEVIQPCLENSISNRPKKKIVLFKKSTSYNGEFNVEEKIVDKKVVKADAYDGETEAKDSSSSEHGEILFKNVEDDGIDSLKYCELNDPSCTEAVSIVCALKVSSKRLKGIDGCDKTIVGCNKLKLNTRRFSQSEVVTVTDEEDLKKFITAKNKHIPDPTPININKKDKDKTHWKTVNGIGQKPHRSLKNRRPTLDFIGTNSGLSSGSVSHDHVLCKGTPVVSEGCKMNKSTVTESTIVSPSDDTETNAALNGNVTSQDGINDDSSEDQQSINSAVESITTKISPVVSTIYIPVELKSSHSQPHTPIIHPENRARHRIEVRKVSSANASPTPFRKNCTLFTTQGSLNRDPQLPHYDQMQLINKNILASSHDQVSFTCLLEQPNTVIDNSISSEDISSRIVDLNEDTITKSHKKRDEFQLLFVKKAQTSFVDKVTSYNSASKSISSTSSGQNSASETKVVKIKRRHRDEYKLASLETFHKKKHRKEMVQLMSETEYERMNSDVNSTGNSTSDGEDICPNVTTTKSKEEDQEQLELVDKNEEEDAIVELGTNFSVTSKNDNNTSTEDVFRLAQTGDVLPPEITPDDPFVLWYKEAHAPGSLHGMTGSVSCYIWEKDELKKTNLTLLDIGWSIIQAVERHEQDKSYSSLGFFIIIGLCFTPLFFRMYINRAYLSTVFDMTRHSNLMDVFLLQNGTFIHSLIANLNSSSSIAIVKHSLGNMSTDHVYSWTNDIVPLALTSILASEWPVRLIIILGIILRLILYTMTFLMLCVAENSFEQRLQYAKHFCRLTSSRRARKYYLPHFRLNKLANIKCWLSLRSYLKKRGPQRSVDSIISSAFYMLLAMLSLVCVNLLQSTDHLFINRLINWDLMLCSVALGIFMMRFLVLGTKITKKYRNLSVIITEQINLFLAMQTRPHKKEELTLAHNVLRLAESLLKEVEGPFRVCGWSMNPFLYNILKVVILSVFSTVLSETCGFKMKLYKIKINPANW